MQIRMRDMAQESCERGTPIDPTYWRYLRAWVVLGIVAFVALLVVFYLMVAKPV